MFCAICQSSHGRWRLAHRLVTHLYYIDPQLSLPTDLCCNYKFTKYKLSINNRIFTCGIFGFMVILKQHNQEYTISTTRYFSLRSTHTLPLNYSVTLCCTYINTHSHTFPPTLSTVSHHGSTALTLQYTWCEGSSGTSDCQSCQPKAHQGKVEHSGSGPPHTHSYTLVRTQRSTSHLLPPVQQSISK